MSAIPGPGPSTLTARRGASFLVSLVGRDTSTENGGGGGLAENTKIGIGLGLSESSRYVSPSCELIGFPSPVCFFGLIVSWAVILKWRRSRKPMTDDEKIAQATFVRWIDRIARAPAVQRARDEEDRAHFDAVATRRRQSVSTFSSSHTRKSISQQETFELKLPAKAHLADA